MPAVFTVTEKKLLEILSDGMPHSKYQLLEVLDDGLAAVGALRVHITNIRKKLPAGQIIVCEYARQQTFYRHARLLQLASLE